MSVGSVLKVVVVDVEKAGAAIVHEIAALPSQVDHAVIDLFKVTAGFFGSAAVKQAVALAEQAAAQYFTGKAAGEISIIEHTQAFEWVKGELLAVGVSPNIVDAHALAGLALSWVSKGISLVEGGIAGAETAAGLSEAASLPPVGN